MGNCERMDWWVEVCGCDIYDINAVSKSGSNNMMVTRHNFSLITLTIAFMYHEKDFNIMKLIFRLHQQVTILKHITTRND